LSIHSRYGYVSNSASAHSHEKYPLLLLSVPTGLCGRPSWRRSGRRLSHLSLDQQAELASGVVIVRPCLCRLASQTAIWQRLTVRQCPPASTSEHWHRHRQCQWGPHWAQTREKERGGKDALPVCLPSSPLRSSVKGHNHHKSDSVLCSTLLEVEEGESPPTLSMRLRTMTLANVAHRRYNCSRRPPHILTLQSAALRTSADPTPKPPPPHPTPQHIHHALPLGASRRRDGLHVLSVGRLCRPSVGTERRSVEHEHRPERPDQPDRHERFE
jgi:hypothetical protein